MVREPATQCSLPLYSEPHPSNTDGKMVSVKRMRKANGSTVLNRQKNSTKQRKPVQRLAICTAVAARHSMQ